MQLFYIKRVLFLTLFSIFFIVHSDEPIWQKKVDTSGTEKPLVILIPSYNNSAWIERTLNSVFSQRYSNYRVVYIDDGSTDDSCARVEKYIKDHRVENKITFIKNEKRCRKLKNVYTAIHRYCADEEIVCMLDCDDFWSDIQAFSFINKMYADPNVWFTYGQDYPYPEMEAARWGITVKNLSAPTPDSVVRTNSFRQFNWVYMHPRTFYAWLFKITPLDEMISSTVPGYKGKFFPACIDYIFIYPMLEMAQSHMKYNPKLLYYWNAANPINSFKVDRQLQALSAMETRKKHPYKALQHAMPYRLDSFKNSCADLIIFSDNTPEALKAFIPSAEQQMTAVENIIIVYQADDEDKDQDYLELIHQYPHIYWHNINNKEKSLKELLSIGSSKHCVLTKDIVSIVKHINCNNGILALEETGAYAFFYNLGSENGCICNTSGGIVNVPSQEIMDGWYAWKFACDERRIVKQNSPAMVLYRKSDMASLLKINANTIHDYIEKWEAVLPDQNKVGLLFSTPSILS